MEKKQFWIKETNVGDNHKEEGKEKVTKSRLFVFSF
jgi:mannose/fructose/N-acetylgalactosamine-specific phosphotransferase system component IIB